MAKLQLYEKTMQWGRVRYVPWQERYRATLHLEDAELCTILSGMVTGFLMAAEDHFPPHARVRREIQTIEKSLRTISAGQDLDPSMYPLAWGALNAALAFLEDEAGAAVKQ